jgi:hypothetical protein
LNREDRKACTEPAEVIAKKFKNLCVLGVIRGSLLQDQKLYRDLEKAIIQRTAPLDAVPLFAYNI